MAKKILIVEDDTFLQELEARKLSKEGYEILTAGDGAEGLRILKKEKIDILLLDLLLPGIDGFELLEQIKKDKDLKEIPIVVFSNLSEEKDIEHAKSLGISEFMVKSNFTLDELVAKIKEITK